MKKIIRFVVFWLVVFLLCAVSGATLAQTSAVADKVSLTGYGVAVSLDKMEYITDFMPPGWTPPVIKMAMCIYNNTSSAITMNFANSKCYDFMIYNSFGAEVWRWSSNRAFLDVECQRTLQPGESVYYKAECKFVGKDGSPMPEGKYFLKGISTALLTSTIDNKLGMLEAKAPFKHSYLH